MMVYYREEQRFNQWWIWLPVIFIAVLMWFGFIKQILFHEPWGERPAPAPVLIAFWITFGIFLPLLFLIIKMVTEIQDDYIYIHFFWKKKIFYKDLKSWEAVTYRPIREYGGWGIRFGGKRGMAYTVSGNRGVQCELKNGKKILIGSRTPEELIRAIDSVYGNFR